MRKYSGINLMELYAKGNNTAWNIMLQECLDKLDINALARVKYEIQIGMDDIVNQKLNTENIIVWFLRLDRSLEQTAKKIIKIRNPMPADDPLDKDRSLKQLQAKRKRDNELMIFLKKSSF